MESAEGRYQPALRGALSRQGAAQPGVDEAVHRRLWFAACAAWEDYDGSAAVPDATGCGRVGNYARDRASDACGMAAWSTARADGERTRWQAEHGCCLEAFGGSRVHLLLPGGFGGAGGAAWCVLRGAR